MWRSEKLLLYLNYKKYKGKGMTNVLGDELKTCSSAGMAMTGFTRDGFCSNHNGDEGSHHICVKNIDGNDSGQTFCGITNQEDWCSTKDRCHEDPNQMCPRNNWCVCEWAFDSFVKAKGCDAFTIDCDATNSLVLEHYDEDTNSEALACIRKQCPKGPLQK